MTTLVDLHGTTTPAPDARAPDPGAPRVGQRTGFWIVAGAFLAAMAFSTVPTPLYPLYQGRDGFSSFVVTVVFAAYAVGVVASLLLAGHLSDRLGRRRVLLPALALEVLAALVFLLWPALPGLVVARVVTGAGIGMVTSTATAYLRDLHALDRPGAGPGRFEAVSTAANLGGLGAGTLASGALAEFVRSPLTVPYAVFAGVLALAIAGVASVPETVERPAVRARYRPQSISLGHGRRADAVMAAAGAFVGFAVFGLFTSLAPGFVGVTLHHPSRLLAGTVPFLAFGAAAIAQTATGKLSLRARLLAGVTGQGAGLAVLAVAVEQADLASFLVGGTIAGAGAGVLFTAALASYVGAAPPAARGEAASSLFLLAYLGLVVPVLGMGVATLYVSAQRAMVVFAAVLVAGLAVVAALALRQRVGSPDR